MNSQIPWTAFWACLILANVQDKEVLSWGWFMMALIWLILYVRTKE